MIRIHKENKEFLTGSLTYLAGEYNFIGYGRFNRSEQSVILVNNNDYPITKEVSVWQLGIPKEAILRQLILTSSEGFTTEKKEYPIISGKLMITMPPKSAAVLKHYPMEDEEEI